MSHAFPNLQAHPTLTPNPTFQPQPLPLTLATMTQQHPHQPHQPHQPPPNPNTNTTHTNNNNNHNTSPLPPPSHTIHTPQPPMQFIPPPHTYTPHTNNMIRLHPTNPNHTPDYNQLTNGQIINHTTHPPPLTHENDIVSQDLNDINTSTSNDESGGGIDSNSTTTNSNPKTCNNNMGEKGGDEDNDIDITDNTTNNNNNNNNNNRPPTLTPLTHTHGPFGGIYADTHTLHHPQHINTHGHGPFGSNTHTTHDMDRNKNGHKLSYYGVMPSPFMPHGPPPNTMLPPHTYDAHTHDDQTHKNEHNTPNNHNGVGTHAWQFIVPQQIPNVAPMFGHPPYLPNDYLRKPTYGEQTMVDVPHVTTAQLSEDVENNNHKNPSISMLISGSINPIQSELNIEHSINTNNHIINSNNSSPSKSCDNSNSRSSRERDRDSNNHNSSNKKESSHSHRKKRKHRKHRDHKRERKEKRKHRGDNHRNNREDTKSKYVSIRGGNYTGNDNEQSVKGGAGNGYRMVLDEPVNKNMLSCHQCKNKKTLDRIIVCGHVYRINNTVKTCTKKYCKSCLLRFYLEAPPTDNQDPSWSSWKCPCCRYICCCAWCRKKKAKRLESVSNAIRAEAHRLTPAISLARKLVSESRVNNNQQSPSQSQSQSSSHKKRINRNHNDIPPQI